MSRWKRGTGLKLQRKLYLIVGAEAMAEKNFTLKEKTQARIIA